MNLRPYQSAATGREHGGRDAATGEGTAREDARPTGAQRTDAPYLLHPLCSFAAIESVFIRVHPWLNNERGAARYFACSKLVSTSRNCWLSGAVARAVCTICRASA